MELKRVVVTGLGAITPVGNNPEETWNNLLNGVSGAAPITLFDASQFKTQFACEVKDFNATDYIDRKEARKMDRYAQLAMAAAVQAVDDSKMDVEGVDKNRIGVVFGVGIGGIKTFEDEVGYYAQHKENGPKFNPFFIPKMISDIAAGQISIRFGFHGPNYATTSACASSTNALADAFNLIRLGKADAIVAGGAEAAICACGVGGFNAMHALSTRNDDPEHASRPFSASRDGFIMGEGAGCLILEELEHAKARGAKIYAEMVGEGMSALCPNKTLAANADEVGEVVKIFESLGKAEIVGENLMDAVTGVSGSSPAYVFMFIEALADAAVMAGMPRDMSYTFAAQSVLGSAKLMLETGKHPGELKDMVCSPAGTTIEAVRVLEEKGLRSAVIEAVRACVEKSRSL